MGGVEGKAEGMREGMMQVRGLGRFKGFDGGEALGGRGCQVGQPGKS